MDIEDATNLYIEAGAMSGPPEHRHQIEFPDAVARFFRDDERDAEVISMRVNSKGPDWPRPLTYRGTDYGQWTEIWRLGLLTARMDGPEYAGRLLRLERLKQGVTQSTDCKSRIREAQMRPSGDPQRSGR
jgi:hypothetical protein